MLAVMMAVLLGLAGCDADAEKSPFVLEVVLNHRTKPIQTITSDDPDVIITWESEAIRATRIYDDYAAGTSAHVITFSIHHVDGDAATGQALAGACGTSCTYPFCPLPEDVVLERIEVDPPFLFVPHENVCMTCEGGGKEIKACG